MARKPKYRRHSSNDLAFVEHSGKRLYLPGRYGSEESQTAYVSFLKSVGFLIYESMRPECAVTLPMLVGRFLSWADATYPPGRRSRAANLWCFAKLLGKFSSVDLAVNFTPLKLKAFQQWLVARGLSRRYINDTTVAVRQMFKWAVSEELIPVTTYQALMTVPGLKLGRTAARESVPRRPVEWERVKETMKKLNSTVRVMVEVHWLTGVRSQSLCAARVGQFDTSGKLWTWKPKHKTEHLGHDLTLYVGPQAQRLLKPLLAGKQPTDYVFQPRNKAGSRSRRYRSFYDSDSYRQAVGRAAKMAKVPHWSPHQLRHARGTLVRAKYGLEAAQAALGHARIDATQIYAQKQVELAKEVARTMG